VSKYPHTLASCQETMGSHKFLPFLSIHATLQDTDSPSEISPWRFLCIGFRYSKNVADCINKLTMLTASGICASPVAYMVLCVRFVSFCSHLPQSKPQATLRQKRNTRYGWLVRPYEINPLTSPVRDFHPERNDKLRLSHWNRIFAV
jgi:hypothetical protein